MSNKGKYLDRYSVVIHTHVNDMTKKVKVLLYKELGYFPVHITLVGVDHDVSTPSSLLQPTF